MFSSNPLCRVPKTSIWNTTHEEEEEEELRHCKPVISFHQPFSLVGYLFFFIVRISFRPVGGGIAVPQG